MSSQKNIDFKNKIFFKLAPAPADDVLPVIQPILVDDEEVLFSFTSMRDSVVFTNKRFISVNVQGITGKKKDFTSIPYKNISAFSVETSGTLDLDTEITVWLSGLGAATFEFTRGTDVRQICQVISAYIL